MKIKILLLPSFECVVRKCSQTFSTQQHTHTHRSSWVLSYDTAQSVYSNGERTLCSTIVCVLFLKVLNILIRLNVLVRSSIQYDVLVFSYYVLVCSSIQQYDVLVFSYYVLVCYSMIQYALVYSSMIFQYFLIMFYHVLVCSGMLQCAIVCSSMLQYVLVFYSIQQYNVVHSLHILRMTTLLVYTIYLFRTIQN